MEFTITKRRHPIIIGESFNFDDLDYLGEALGEYWWKLDALSFRIKML